MENNEPKIFKTEIEEKAVKIVLHYFENIVPDKLELEYSYNEVQVLFKQNDLSIHFLSSSKRLGINGKYTTLSAEANKYLHQRVIEVFKTDNINSEFNKEVLNLEQIWKK